MSNITKHVGRIRSTDQRCAIIMNQIPDKADHALIVNIEQLNVRYEQMIMEVVNSREGQDANELGSVMNRRSDPNSGRTVLQEFHFNGLMRAEPITNIVLYPRPNAPIELADVVRAMASNGQAQDIQGFAPQNEAVVKVDAASDPKEVALNLLAEADLLMDEANKKREAAYRVDPTLRPVETAIEEVNGLSDTAIEKVADASEPVKRAGRPKKQPVNG